MIGRPPSTTDKACWPLMRLAGGAHSKGTVTRMGWREKVAAPQATSGPRAAVLRLCDDTELDAVASALLPAERSRSAGRRSPLLTSADNSAELARSRALNPQSMVPGARRWAGWPASSLQAGCSLSTAGRSTR